MAHVQTRKKRLKRPLLRDIDGIVAWLRQRKCQFPVSRHVLYRKYEIYSEVTIHGLARRGLLVLSEANDGSLSTGMANVLEEIGIASKADFRKKYAAGQLELRRYRGVGKRNRNLLLAWAGLPVPDDGRRTIPVELSAPTIGALDRLVEERGCASRAELITRLVAELTGAPAA